MPQSINLYERLTHVYNDAWRHLDRSQYVGTVKQLGPTRVIPAEGYDDGGQYHFRVVAPTELKSINLSQSIRSTLSNSECTHEYDCCGCVRTSARVRRLTPREYSIKVSVSYNY